MKKVFIVFLAAVLTASYAQAQEMTYGVRAGFNLTNMWGGDGLDTKMKPGFQIGIVADYDIMEDFAFQMGLLFATQGFKTEADEDDFSLTTNLNYLQIPMNAQYKLDLGGAKLLLQAGPYLGYGLGGKMTGKVGSKSVSENIKFGDDGFNAFDFGLGFGAGLQFNNVQVGLGYNLGLAKFSADGFRNNGLAVTLTYLLGK